MPLSSLKPILRTLAVGLVFVCVPASLLVNSSAVLASSVQSSDDGGKEGADRVFESVEQLLAQAFSANAPKPSMLWLDQSARDEAKLVAEEDPGFRRRYWREDDTTVWVLDVIGRDHPITVGVIVNNDGIKAMNVLVYRESRGWEVRHEFFTKQFNGIELKGKKLDKRIDGITGATLSVRALQRAARLALWLHQRAIAS